MIEIKLLRTYEKLLRGTNDIVYHSVATVYEWLITRLGVYMDEIRFVETFCVIGGFRYGLEQANKMEKCIESLKGIRSLQRGCDAFPKDTSSLHDNKSDFILIRRITK